MLSALADINFAPTPSGRASRFDRWPIEGDHRVPPRSEEGMHYLPDAKFDDDPHSAEYVLGLWIEWQWIAADAKSARVRFAIRANEDGASSYLLHPGSRFRLYEAFHHVASGVARSEPESIDPSIKLRSANA